MPKNLNKIDVETLSRDIPKYFGHMTESNIGKWKNLLMQLREESFLEGPVNPPWPLDELVQFERPERPVAEDEAVPPELIELRRKEAAPLETVR